MNKEQDIQQKNLIYNPSQDQLSRSKVGLKNQLLPKVKQSELERYQKGQATSQNSSSYYSNTPAQEKGHKRIFSQYEKKSDNINQYTNQIQQILEKIDDPEFSENRTKSDALYQIKSQNLFMQGPLSMKSRELGISSKQFKRNTFFPLKDNQSKQQSREQSEKKNTNSKQLVSPNKSNININDEQGEQFFMRNNFSSASPNRVITNASNRYGFTSPKQSVETQKKNNEDIKNNVNNLMQQQINQHLRSLSHIQEGFQNNQENGLFLKDLQSKQDGKDYLGSDKDIQLPLSLNEQKSQNFNMSQLREGISKSLGFGKKNTYTSYDTRFHEIKKLNSDNQKLKHQIQDIQFELEDMDEFKIALEHQQKAEDINEMRFDILKAQISRQQKHIRRLTGLLQGSRKAMKEALSICKFFADIVLNYKDELYNDNYPTSQKPNVNQNKVISNVQQEGQQVNNNENATPIAAAVYQDNVYLPSNEEGIIMQLDQKLMNLSLKNLLNNFGSHEERDNFKNNFFSAYNKIVEYERSNKEFSSLFMIKEQKKLTSLPQSLHGSLTNLDRSAQQSQIFQDALLEVQSIGQGQDTIARKDPNRKHVMKNKVKYNYPVKEFLTKYKDYVPINTIFSSFPSQQKDNLSNMVNVLACILKKCEKGFKQIRAFQLYKSNPYLYVDKKNRVDIPDTLQNYKSDFETYMKYRDKMISINISHEQMMKTESQLTQFLNILVQFYSQFLIDNKHEPNQEISNVINETRKAIEQMVCLGVMLNKDAGSNNARYLMVAQHIGSELSLNNIKSSDKQNVSILTNDLKDEQNASKYLNMSKEDQLINSISMQKSPKQLASSDDIQLIGSQNQINLDKIENVQNMRKMKIMQKKAEFQKLQQQLLDELKDYEQLRTLKIDKDVDCNTDFFDRQSICENIFDDLYKNLRIGEFQDSINLALKLGTMIHKMKYNFEMKNNMLLMKETQIDYLKNQIYVYKQDIIQCHYFINETQEAINNFFSPINQKLNLILSLFNNIMDGTKSSDPKSRKNFILSFKKNLKEILEIIKRIEDKNYPIDTLNIKQLRDTFHQKVDLACMKNETIKKHLLSL